MAAPRKVFRIEETAAAHLAPGADIAQASPYDAEVMQALRALHATMAAPTSAAPPPKATHRDAAAQTVRLDRIAQELEAVTGGTAQATQKILTAAEEIDQIANNLAAALKGRLEQGLALDISELVIRIFEACNFQDVIGQRISKVMATLTIEDRVGRMLDDSNRPAPAPADDTAQSLHGPRLESDGGHLSQSEIDAMFGG